MKKNKTIAYMLAATLLVGGTFLGTKALFYDQIESVGELKISTGDVDINVSSEEWDIVGTRNETNHGTTEGNPNTLQENLATFDNLKYGDIITKTITVTNEGTLNADLKLIEDTTKTELLPKGIDFTTSFSTEQNDGYLGDENGGVLKPGESVDLTLKLEVTGGGIHVPDNDSTIENDQNDANKLNSDAQERIIIDLQNAYTLKATQTQSGSQQQNNR